MRHLYQEMYTDCVMLDRSIVPDGEGGYISRFTEGAAFSCAIVRDDSSTALVAQAQGLNNLYTVTVDKGMPLEFHDVFRRISDGQVFRVTSNADDKQAPARATMQIAQVTAEEWRIPG